MAESSFRIQSSSLSKLMIRFVVCGKRDSLGLEIGSAEAGGGDALLSRALLCTASACLGKKRKEYERVQRRPLCLRASEESSPRTVVRNGLNPGAVKISTPFTKHHPIE